MIKDFKRKLRKIKDFDGISLILLLKIKTYNIDKRLVDNIKTFIKQLFRQKIINQYLRNFFKINQEINLKSKITIYGLLTENLKQKKKEKVRRMMKTDEKIAQSSLRIWLVLEKVILN